MDNLVGFSVTMLNRNICKFPPQIIAFIQNWSWSHCRKNTILYRLDNFQTVRYLEILKILTYVWTTQKWKKTSQKICWQIFRNFDPNLFSRGLAREECDAHLPLPLTLQFAPVYIGSNRTMTKHLLRLLLMSWRCKPLHDMGDNCLRYKGLV
jgi:hypothetical protein